ncbi:RNA-binding protein 7 isoform X1 [Rattus norvegicus]|uniref:RNA-binding protein 7 isoform X1 n=1 Tax=Rattus norvegicus TaxID=10116 RepID=UPI002FD7DAEB
MGAAAAEADRTLFVGNLETKVTEELLFELFHQVRGGRGPRAAVAFTGSDKERSAPGRNSGTFGPKVTSDDGDICVSTPVKSRDPRWNLSIAFPFSYVPCLPLIELIGLCFIAQYLRQRDSLYSLGSPGTPRLTLSWSSCLHPLTSDNTGWASNKGENPKR